MAINSYGYPSLIAPGSVFARVMQHAGHRYSVAGFGDFRVTAAASGTRRVNIAAGWATGQGITVNNTAPTTLDLSAPSGSSQWFLIGLNRWATNPAYDPGAAPGTPESSPYISQIVAVAGSASRAVPTVTQNPGTDDTQWLALCRVTSSSTLVADVVDLRLISTEGGGFYVCYSDLAMEQLDSVVGADVYRADTTNGHKPTIYRRVASMGGSLNWKNLSLPDTDLAYASFVNGPAEPGWIMQNTQRLVVNGTMLWVHIDVVKSGGQIIADSEGTIPGHTNILTLNSEWSPKDPVSGSGYVTNSAGNARRDAGIRINSQGLVHFTSTLPGARVDRVTADAFYSIA